MLIEIEDTPEFYSKIIDVLKTGDIIALPTDTVYGFAVDGTNFDAIKRLAEIKGRVDKSFTLFLQKNQIEKYAILIKRKIVEYFVPGPLTIILKKRTGVSLPYITEKIGIRIPQISFIIKLLSHYNKPLAVTSANLSGNDTLRSASEIAERFTDINLVINGGDLLSRPSTVLDLTATPPAIKRKGAIPILEIEKVYGRNIMIDNSLEFNVLFVCSGNTCRSPMAEGILKTLVNREYCGIKSAGTLPMVGLPPSQHAHTVVEEYGGSIMHHVSQTITKKLLEWADLVLVMEYKHYIAVLDILPRAAVKTFLLKEYKRRVKYNEITDPVGLDLDFYYKTAKDMLSSLKLIARDIKRRFEKG